MAKVIAKAIGYYGGVVRTIGESFTIPDDVWRDEKRRPSWVKLDPASVFGGNGDHDGDGNVGGSKPAGPSDGAPAFDDMTVVQLREYAKENGVDLGSVTKKADIVALLKGEAVGGSVDAQTSQPFGDNGGPETVQGTGVTQALGGAAPDWIAPGTPHTPVMAQE